MKLEDLTGQIFGKLTVHILIRLKGRVNWMCTCECGNITTVLASSLKMKQTTSCGCVHKAMVSKMFSTHGLTNTPEYHIWAEMKQRCYNPKHPKYSRYGGRGIIICDRWLNSFENFLKDMGQRPNDNLSIDRINNDGIYEPINCRWATPLEQASNRGGYHE